MPNVLLIIICVVKVPLFIWLLLDRVLRVHQIRRRPELLLVWRKAKALVGYWRKHPFVVWSLADLTRLAGVIYKLEL